jgi:hypothetical protein
MTTNPGNARRWSVGADLTFWSGAGLAVAVWSRSLAGAWSAPHPVLLAGGLAFALAGPPAIPLLLRLPSVPWSLVRAFALGNMALTPLLPLLAAVNALGLSTTGNAWLASAAVATLGFGAWQWSAGGVRQLEQARAV